METLESTCFNINLPFNSHLNINEVARKIRGKLALGFRRLSAERHVNVSRALAFTRIEHLGYVVMLEGFKTTLRDVFDAPDLYHNLNFIHIINQVIVGLQHMHVHNIFHGALCPENIYIAPGGIVKLGGYAVPFLTHTCVDEHVKLHAYGAKSATANRASVGFYWSPHKILGKGCLDFYKDDIWSLGICILDVLKCILGVENKATPPVGRNALIFVAALALLVPGQDDDLNVSALGLDFKRHLAQLLLEDGHELDFKGALDLLKHESFFKDTFNDVCSDIRPFWQTINVEGGFNDDSVCDFFDEINAIIDLWSGIDIVNKLTSDADTSNSLQDHVLYLYSLAVDCLCINEDSRPCALDLLAKFQSFDVGDFNPCCSQGGSDTLTARGLPFTGSGRSLDSLKGSGGALYDTLKPSAASNFKHDKDQITQCSDYTWHCTPSSLKTDVAFNTSEDLSAEIVYFFNLLGYRQNDLLHLGLVRPWSTPPLLLSESDSHIREDTNTIEVSLTVHETNFDLKALYENMDLANLFPMVIEHQVRPTCVYARECDFLYQWIRIGRFKRLLQHPKDCQEQIKLEACIDVAPLQRKYVWCVLLDVFDARQYKHKQTPIAHVAKVVQHYDIDLLGSAEVQESIASIVATLDVNNSFPSCIYHVCIVLYLVLRGDDALVYTALEAVYEKYLKNYYAPSGSFVQLDLSEFVTLLNFFDPELAIHLTRIGAFPDSFALPWFMSLFSTRMTFAQVVLLWDAIFTIDDVLYIKFVAVVILHSMRAKLLEINDATGAVQYITTVLDSLNVPMLARVAAFLYQQWHVILFCGNALADNDNENEASPKFDLERNTIVYTRNQYPLERCFKLDAATVKRILEKCIVIDVSSRESYKARHLSDSIHIDDALDILSQCCSRVNYDDYYDNAANNGNNNNSTSFGAHGKVTQVATFGAKSVSMLVANLTLEKYDVKNRVLARFDDLICNCNGAPWLQEVPGKDCIALALGDSNDFEAQQDALYQLLYQFHVQHLCFYQVTNKDWLKFFATTPTDANTNLSHET